MIVFFKSLKTSFLLLTFISFIILSGCKPKTETPQEKQTPGISDTSAKSVQPPDTTKEVKDSTMDLTGRWTGTVAQRPATFNITKQDGEKFSGSMTISAREPMLKQVSGKFDKSTMNLTMNDTNHSRYKGSYRGKLSAAGKMQGTFVMELDGKSYTFNLTKK